MTPRQIDLVQGSWIRVHDSRSEFADRFYEALFSARPDYRVLFTSDLQEQGRKLMAMLNAVILNLKNLAPIRERAQELGRLHARLGLGRSDYLLMQDVLLSTLASTCGEPMDSELLEAWIEAYTLATETMLSAPSVGTS